MTEDPIDRCNCRSHAVVQERREVGDRVHGDGRLQGAQRVRRVRIPGFVKMSVVNKPATEARMGVNPFTKEPMQFAAKPASKSVKASPLKVAKDAV